MTANFDLSGRLALVSGSSRGLGLAIARGLARAGARVLLHGRDEAGLPATLRDLPNAAGFLAFDVSDTRATTDAFARIRTEHGGLDIWSTTPASSPANRCWTPPMRIGRPSSIPTCRRISACRERPRA
jgi:NAD(P)-dependent dehydrogenase (short-subunit alcohol dehydrogenase family)